MKWIILVLGGIFLPSVMAHAMDHSGTINFTQENDIFYGHDRYYTNGMRLSWVPGPNSSPPLWAESIANTLPMFRKNPVVRHGYAFGQNIFTASDITASDPPLDDRPYAGWTYLSIGMGSETEKHLDLLILSLGVVGPASYAKQTQRFVHEIFGSDKPMGWGTQLSNEPGAILTYQRIWRAHADVTMHAHQIDFSSHLGTALGNIFTYANAGITMRYGRHLPKDYGPPRIQPGLPGSSDFSPASNFGWYIFMGMEGRAVARNIFLDGNTFRESRSVEKHPFVADLQLGFVLDWNRFRVSYTHVRRSQEFKGQNGDNRFGSITISYKI